MFVGFNYSASKYDFEDADYEIGKKLFEDQKRAIQSNLSTYLDKNGNINAKQLCEEWFPQIDVDIFLSHSHKDQELVISLAGWLYEHLGITSFVDSCLWGYANKIQRQIDNNCCVLKRDKNGNIKSYCYEDRNQSTSHVHMILNGALAKMIDRTECIMFVNTPNSLFLKNEEGNNQTYSPWIYSELLISRIVRKKPPRGYREDVKKAISESYSDLKVKYDVDLTHLINLEIEDLKCVKSNSITKDSRKNLDLLYEIVGVY